MIQNKFLQLAYELATEAYKSDEVPVGAVIVNRYGRVIAARHNEMQKQNNPMAHAEILAIKDAREIINDKYLSDCAIYVTLEPCPMCAQAISYMRFKTLFFSAYDIKFGGVINNAKIFSQNSCHHKIEIYHGIMSTQVEMLLKKFFTQRRENSKTVTENYMFKQLNQNNFKERNMSDNFYNQQHQLGCQKANQTQYPFTLPPLPYDLEALSPHLSGREMDFHYNKHHKAYVDKLNELIIDTKLAEKSLEEIIFLVKDKSFQGFTEDKKTVIFNNAAQIWNHTFYWHCMKRDGGEIYGKIKEKIDQKFGSFADFKKEFKNAALTQFGSGWAWLVLDKGDLKIVKTSNAEMPLVNGQKPILTCDVWEHAYYIDYQNRRGDYIDIFLDNLVNWEFVNNNLDVNAKR